MRESLRSFFSPTATAPMRACSLRSNKTLGSFSDDDGDGDGSETVKTAIGLLSKTTGLHVHHAFLYIS